jgi:hypothetical protein
MTIDRDLEDGLAQQTRRRSPKDDRRGQSHPEGSRIWGPPDCVLLFDTGRHHRSRREVQQKVSQPTR